MAEDQIGTVAKFFAKPSVAAIRVTTGNVKIGDRLRFAGHTTDFTQQLTSMEIENQPVQSAEAGDMVGVKVKERVRENDRVYKIVD